MNALKADVTPKKFKASSYALGDAAINPVPNLWSPCSPATKLSHPPAVVWKRPRFVAPWTDHPFWTPILRNENRHNFFGRHS